MNPLVVMAIGLGIVAFVGLVVCSHESKSVVTPPPTDPTQEWEDVPGRMDRIQVPGGWIYRRYFSGHSISICFVPFPATQKQEPITALTGDVTASTPCDIKIKIKRKKKKKTYNYRDARDG